MSLMTSFSDNNHTHWGNPRYDDLVLKAMSQPSGSKRKALYDEAQKILLEEDVAVLPIYAGVSHILVSPRLKRYSLNVMSEVYFGDVEFKKEKD